MRELTLDEVLADDRPAESLLAGQKWFYDPDRTGGELRIRTRAGDLRGSREERKITIDVPGEDGQLVPVTFFAPEKHWRHQSGCDRREREELGPEVRRG